MTNQAIPVTSLSSPPVSRWLGFFPEFRDDSLGFLLRCHAYGDVVKLPMGGGRRCLGESFAELEGLLVLATLASKVQLRLVDGPTILPDPLMTLKPKIPVRMTIESVGTPERHPTTV